jgi:hypothetical protein
MLAKGRRSFVHYRLHSYEDIDAEKKGPVRGDL